MLVRVDPAVVEEVAARLRSAAGRAHQATGPRFEAGDWSGPAAEAAAAAATRVDADAALVRDMSVAAGGLLASFAAEAAELAARERALGADTGQVQAANAAWVAAGSPGRDPSLDLLQTLRRRQRALAMEYEELSGRLAGALDRLRVQIPDRPLHARDQWEGFRDAAAANLVGAAGPAYGLTVDAAVDRQRWWATVRATPAPTCRTSMAFRGRHGLTTSARSCDALPDPRCRRDRSAAPASPRFPVRRCSMTTRWRTGRQRW